MACEKCNGLLADYRRILREYTIAVGKLSGLLGDDFRLASQEAQRLRLACRAAEELWPLIGGRPMSP